ncbi:hypothetical protein AwMethylo_13380 [Methylobacterium sp.]|nr:hypothetical protein AwMethylo_13380 [Methylobacterium sp.]
MRRKRVTAMSAPRTVAKISRFEGVIAKKITFESGKNMEGALSAEGDAGPARVRVGTGTRDVVTTRRPGTRQACPVSVR